MAGRIQPSGGRRRYMAEINVTPLVDVVLVLLIIFMVTAPMMTKGLKIQLPRTTAKALPQKHQPVVVSMNSKGAIFLNGVRIDERGLIARLKKIRKDSPGKQVFLKADKAVKYGVVARLMASMREAGIEDLGLVTKPLRRR